jgi:hypothetical protein
MRKSTAAKSSARPSDDLEKIRLRAYELYVERGMVDGYAEEDWRRAEEEILGRKSGDRSTEAAA